jgi:type IV pilus assembly protein PilY1
MRLKPLVSMMALLPVMVLPTSTAIFASDLGIYKGNTAGKTNIFLMLDTSGSMGISSLVLPKNNQYGSPGDVDNPLCDRVDVKEYKNDYKDSTAINFKEWAYNLKDTRTTSPTYNKTSIYKSVTIGNTTIPYYVRGCTAGGVTQYDRLSRLKDAILPLLAGTQLSDSVVMGLGQFSARTGLTIGNVPTKLVDGHSGRIIVPNGALTSQQRIKIAQALAAIKSVDTTTDEDGTSNVNLKISSQTYPDIIKAASGTPTAHAYAEAAAYMMGTGTGGIATSATKVGYIYDGYMLKQKGSEQVYLLCATSGGGTTSALGATVKQCPSDWPEWDNNNKTVTGTSVYKPYDGSCTRAASPNKDWCSVSYTDFKTAVGGGMSSLWDAYKKLPIGWRFDGWVKVPSEPLDIEPVVGTVWGYPDSINGLVSYRTSPFSLDGTNDNTVGGFAYSASDSKKTDNTNTYIKAGSSSECDGNGIYFLTDGAPNSTKDVMARTIMNKSLSDNATYTFTAQPSGTGVLVSPTLKSDLFAGETGGWEYIGEYAKKLRDKTKNPGGISIKTAVVGFGASFEGLTRKADGTYDCDTVTATQDAKNACKWGSKGAGFGEGGFYQATNSDDIANSIIKFVEDIKVSFTPSSLGSISVPRDPLDQTKYMTQGFFPMVMPMEDTSLRTWAGNLKKYNIVGGTLKDSSGNAIYKLENNQQVINSSAKDIWSNATTGTDHSLINSGGAWNKIPVPSTATEALDAISNLNSVRKVYTMDGSNLRKVTKDNLATNYSGIDAFTSTLSINQRLAFLNYLGFKTTFPATATQTTLTANEIAPLAVNPISPYRFLGGVVHSTPLMVTKESTVSSNNAVGTREEYTVYGSMEGGLHIVNSATGKEQSVFVPQEILSNQYDTLANGNSKGVGALTGVTYGVDAPWVADNTFKVQTTTSNGTATTKYIANKINIYGGLRMGGSALYGLDILNPTSPNLLFQIKPTTTNEFRRMAQIWSKPTVAEIRVKGVRKKVLIFGGGYDAAVYERPATSFTEPSSTYGNALYVVDATTGALIWMSSSDTSGIIDSYKKTTQADLKYSVVGQPVVRDYDADGLADMIYFADLGGQIFRVDLNNNNQTSKTADTNIAVRVQTLAKLRTTDATPFIPRFYDRLSTAVFDDGQNRFVLVTAGSGNRSFPLEEEIGGKNKIYGLIDRDAAANDLEKSTFTPATVITPTLLSSDGILGKTVTKQISNTNIAKMKLTTGSDMLRGWSFELRSVDSGNFARSFEESQLITGDLYVSLYDPKATLTGTVNTCGGGVTGISTTHRICMPYGDCAAYVKTSYQGINGPAFGVVSSSDPRTTSLVAPIAETKEYCVGKCPAEKTTLTEQNLPTYSQVRKIKPVRWFEW